MAIQFARGQQLCDGNVEADRDRVGCCDQHAHIARGTLPAITRPVEMPAAAHAHVRVEDEIAREAHEQMLAARDHRLDRASRDRPVLVDARQGGENRLEPRDDPPRQNAVHRLGRAKNCVAFGHKWTIDLRI